MPCCLSEVPDIPSQTCLPNGQLIIVSEDSAIDARPVLRLLLCEFPVDGPLDLTSLLEELFEANRGSCWYFFGTLR